MALRGIQRPLYDFKLGKGLLKRDRRGQVDKVEPVECNEDDQTVHDNSPSIHTIALEVMKIDLAQRSGWKVDNPADSVVKYFDWAQAMWEESVKRADAIG
jgi:hypothetical protein